MLNTRVVEMQALSFIISATLPNSFYEASIILIIINLSQPQMPQERKLQVNIHAKVLNQILAQKEILGGLVVRILAFH